MNLYSSAFINIIYCAEFFLYNQNKECYKYAKFYKTLFGEIYTSILIPILITTVVRFFFYINYTKYIGITYHFNTSLLQLYFIILEVEMETVPSCDTFQATSLLLFPRSKSVAAIQISVPRKARNGSIIYYMLCCNQIILGIFLHQVLKTPPKSAKVNKHVISTNAIQPLLLRAHKLSNTVL